MVFLAPPANAGEYFQTDNLHGLVLVVSRTASPCPDLVTTVFPVYGSASEAEVWLESHSPRIGNAVCVDETACHDAERNMTVHLHEDGAVALGQEGAADVVIDAGESHSWTQRDEDANQTTTATYVLRAMGNWPAAGLSFPSDEETR